MNIKNLLKGYKYDVICGQEDLEINEIAYDSRKIKEKDLFVCIKGFKIDGHSYIENAIDRGAIAIVLEDDTKIDTGKHKNITFIKVEDARKALSYMSNLYYDMPSKFIKLVGITGTNGKTSVSYYISYIMNQVGYKTGIIGTIDNVCGCESLDIMTTTHTTPEALEIHKMLMMMLERHVDVVCMEATSMGLKLARVDDCDFDIAVFTNLTRDHLDDHKTMKDYKESKKILFNLSNISVINIDDKVGKEILQESQNECITYGLSEEAKIYAHDIVISDKGAKFKVTYDYKIYDIKINIPGKFSIYNALAAMGVCLVLGVNMQDIMKALRNIKSVKGRFESINLKNGSKAIIDYAHTPDALKNVLETVNEFKKGDSIVVFGCGGNRDKSKRSIMGKIACDLADKVIITSDNPRYEDPQSIILDIIEGNNDYESKFTIIQDRKNAIEYAISISKKSDVILIAGKGHETTQEIGDEILPFDDCQIVKQYDLLH